MGLQETTEWSETKKRAAKRDVNFKKLRHQPIPVTF